jgi:hypothetical protein
MKPLLTKTELLSLNARFFSFGDFIAMIELKGRNIFYLREDTGYVRLTSEFF